MRWYYYKRKRSCLLTALLLPFYLVFYTVYLVFCLFKALFVGICEFVGGASKVAVDVSKQSKSETQNPKNVIEKPVSVCETPKTVIAEPQAAPENKAMILQGAKILAEQIAAKQGQAGENESNIFDDPKMVEAIALIVSEGKASTPLLQRRLSIGYGRAAKIMDALEVCGFISPPDGNKPRNVFITKNDLLSALNEEK